MPSSTSPFPFDQFEGAPLPDLPPDTEAPIERLFALPEWDLSEYEYAYERQMPEDWPEFTGSLPGSPPTYLDKPSEKMAALFISDLHLSDGGQGDDGIEQHLRRSSNANLYVGGKGGATTSRTLLVARVIRWAVLHAQENGIESIDIVLNGDVFDLLEMIGRGTTTSAKHQTLAKACDWAITNGHGVYYLAGNHDYVIPPGPWQPGWTYSNSTLDTFAEHGHRYDHHNWPPGPQSYGSGLVRGVAERGFLSLARVEVMSTMAGARIEYPLSGVDNLRPIRDDVYKHFLQQHLTAHLLGQGLTKAVVDEAVGSFLKSKLEGQPDDSMNLHGASWMWSTNSKYVGWLMVQGHTHVPVAIPDFYYNTGTFTQTLSNWPLGTKETLIDVFPFLMVWKQAGKREELYCTVNGTSANPKAMTRNRGAVNRLRRGVFGYEPY